MAKHGYNPIQDWLTVFRSPLCFFSFRICIRCGGGKYRHSSEASQTIRKSLVILLRNLRPEEEKYAQDQGNADVEPGID